MLKMANICPMCDGVMKVMDGGDGVKILVCKDCKCSIHFGSWETQKLYASGIEYWTKEEIEEYFL